MSGPPNSRASMYQTGWLNRNPRLGSAMLALGSFFPLTAILHHAIFYRPTCILNNFGSEYTLSVLAAWLTADPSPYIALILSLAVFAMAMYYPGLRLAVVAFLIATIPLSIWIWDIPFTGRFVCHWGHDGRSAINSQDLYIFAAISFGPIWYFLWRKSIASSQGTASAWSR
jgi:hypothetical protein